MFPRHRRPTQLQPLITEYTPEPLYPTTPDAVEPVGRLSFATKLSAGFLLALLAVSFGASWYLASDGQRQFEILHRETEEMALRGRNRVRAVAVSPDGQTIACGVRGGDITLWHVHNGSSRPAGLEQEVSVRCLAFSPDGAYLAAAGGDSAHVRGEVRIWSWRTEELLYDFDLSGAFIESITFSPDGKYLAAAGSDGCVRFWDTREFQLVASVPVSSAPVTSTAFSPDGKQLAVGTDDGHISSWSVGDWKRCGEFAANDGIIWSIAFAPEGRLLASTGEGGAVRLWDLAASGLPREAGRVTGHGRAVAFSPDGQTLAVAGGSVGCPGELRGWDVASLRPSFNLSGHGDVIYGLVWTRDGELVTGSADQTVRAWSPLLASPRLTIQVPTR
jgi:WD40 repeat protein